MFTLKGSYPGPIPFVGVASSPVANEKRSALPNVNSPTKILFLAARDADLERLQQEFATGGRSQAIVRVHGSSELAAQLSHHRFAVVVISTHGPRSDFSAALECWSHAAHRPPLVVWAREIDATAVVSGLRAGATRVVFMERDDVVAGIQQAIESRTSTSAPTGAASAQHRAELFSALAGGVAHDLNNILAPVIMAAGILREQSLGPDEQELVDTIEHSAQRAASMVRQVLTFARGSTACGVVVQSHHLLKEVARLAAEVFPPSISVRAELSTHLWPLVGDPAAIHQAVVQLLVNARDASAEGGQIVLSARNMHVGEIPESRVFSCRPGDFLCIMVEDSGSNTTPDRAAHLWEPYATASAEDAAPTLGLSAVAGVLRSHGGFGRVRCQPGRGMIVELYFPRAALEANRGVQAELRRPESVGKILVVDDEHPILLLSQKILSKAGYEVLVASEGREALNLFVRHRAEIGLVITDLAMPGMNGFTLIWALRRAKPDLRVMVATGEGSEDNIRELEQMGVRHVLLKPFTTKRLLDSVASALADPVESAAALYVHEAIGA